VKGLNLDYQLTLPAIMRRAESLFGHKEVVTRRPDKSFHRYTYADFISRAKRLAVALKGLGIEPGDRVGTLAWNSYHHLETYFGVPSAGAVLHTLNPRLAAHDLVYILEHAEDRVLLIDETMVGLMEAVEGEVDLEHVLVYTYGDDTPGGMRSYEELISDADEADFEYPEYLDERDAAAMCYTSGTTGRPKGALYSHRAICLHSMASAMPDMLDLRETDVVMPVVPMFHVNAWGMPFTATLVGAKQVMPGAHLDPESLIEDLEEEKVTVTAGVPTIWMGILRALDAEPGKHDLSALHSMIIGGSAAPEAMIRGFQERHDLKVIHAWGMTETTPLGTVCRPTSRHQDWSEDDLYALRAKQGNPGPFVEIRARADEGFVPWDGQSMGELELRGPWVAGAYFGDEDPEKFTDDGWFRTGDIVTIDPDGFVEIQDRTKDLIKSGGEWISSVALENALMAHDAVAEAAVIAIASEKWQERPLGIVVLKEGESVTADELQSSLAEQFPKWYLPDAIEFVDEIPHTATGKSLKMKLREQFQDYTPA
jgi:fatty-acyl-CoA synthase